MMKNDEVMNTMRIFLICLLTTIFWCLETRGDQTSVLKKSENNEKSTGFNVTPLYNYHMQNEIVVLMFKADWCSSCKIIKRMLDELKLEFQNDPVSIIYIDTDTLLDVAEFYGVTSLPLIYFYKHGELKESIKAKPKEVIQQIIQELLEIPYTPPLAPVLVNYTLTRNYQYMQGCPYLETIQYVDGLGRDLFTVAKGITPGKRDLVSLTEYDNLGRKSRTWLPGILTTIRGGSIHLDSLKKSMTSSGLHGQDAKPYAETRYEPFSSERKIKIYNPGEDWYDHEKAIIIEYNLNNTFYPCPYYHLTTNGASYVINKTGNYPMNELYVIKSVDEDGNTSFEFINKMGQLVMTQRVNGGKCYNTCYIYDDNTNLCVVLSPKAVKLLGTDGSWNETNVSVQGLCYLYKYDTRNRCVAKKLPGVDWVLNVYDCMDRLVMIQDGNFRKEKKWFYYMYDALDRLIKSNIVINTSNLSRDSIQSLYNTWFNNNNVSREVEKPLQGNIFSLYAKLQEIDYDSYDSLPSSGELAFKPIRDITLSRDNRVKGLMTQEKLYILDDKLGTASPNQVVKAYYYDDKARVIQIATRNKYKYVSRESYKYDFKGNIIARQEIHETSSTRADSLLLTFNYDHASRVISSTAKLNNGILASVEYSYDDLGQVKTKKYGYGSNAINQTMQYNIRGWLERQSSELFETRLRYNVPLLAGTRASYSGNISEWEWLHKQKTGQSFQINTYTFSYDSLYRLNETKQYISGNLNNQYVEKSIRYDENGNILTMQRTSGGTLVDNLSYTYTGNQLVSLRENVRTSPTGDIYLPGNVLDGTYTYDVNGNLISDNRKSIKLEYNFLNLLSEVKTASGVLKTRYVYLSDGTKLDVRDSNEANGFDYLGSLTYRKNSAGLQLESFNFGDGMIRIVGTSNNQQEICYFIKDHLGSVRIVFDGNGLVKERNDYYPFGAKHIRSDYTLSDNRYEFNGKEKQVTGNLDYLDYGVRMYDVGLGRWLGMDKMAESYINITPYNMCGNNPLRYLDANGMNFGDYYTSSGYWIFNDGIDDDKAYVITGKTITKDEINYAVFEELNISNSELVRLAATSYGEGSLANNYKEMAGISSVIVRQANARNVSLLNLLSSSSTYAYAASDGNKRFKKLSDASASDRNGNNGMRLAMKGAINAATGGTDYSNGAYFWDGADISTNYDNHPKIKAGFKIVDDLHNIHSIKSSSVDVTTYWINAKGEATKVRGTYTYTYESTAGYGGTIFSKYSKDFLKATGNKIYK